MENGPGAPTPPIDIAGGAAAAVARPGPARVEVGDDLLARLRSVCVEVTDDPAVVGAASQDWWPLAMTWALEGQLAGRGAVVARPGTPEEVAAVLAACDDARVPVTAAAGRSGVCGASVPVHGGVVLDLCGLTGIRDVDDRSLLVDVLPGTFGDRFEDELRREHGLTCGHWPQSMTLSTVGGWLACRGAGQMSTRYGKIEDIVVGLDVALADGRTITTGGHPRQATGPDLTQLFVGSEGTLGIITGARLAAHPVPDHERRGAWSFASFTDGLDACRRILRRGATPAVLRLYDGVESDRNYHVGTDRNVLLVLDEGDPAVVDGMWQVVESECAAAEPLDVELVEHWMHKRNDVAALESLISAGFVVDTMEISGPWSALPGAYHAAVDAIAAVPGALAASAHCSHSYLDGACLYFTFAGRPGDGDAAPEEKDRFYRAAWDAGTRAVLGAGGSLSHHHGVGLNRARFMGEALGGGLDVLAGVKAALDPNGILNPSKLGLPSPFGPVELV
ncbi:MAG: FAD-binding oxidoreductase [Microthrixaceae bacterium]